MVGVFDGDGSADPVLVRTQPDGSLRWYVRTPSGGSSAFTYGTAGNLVLDPVTGTAVPTA